MTDTRKPPLWRWKELVAACAGRSDRGPSDGKPPAAITGVSIDTRSIEPGDVFVALRDVRDGHEFVPQAFAKGAAVALVAESYARQPGDGALIHVADPLRALEAIGRAARARLAADARVIAITGSAGKTGTKEMLRACLATQGRTHASEKSYNNHWGVPLTLARMSAHTAFAVLEIGMNYAGEITPLAQMARPHIAIITNVLPVHLGHFASEEAIADAKAEIFAGVHRGQTHGSDPAGTDSIGTVVLNRDDRHYARLVARAEALGLRVLSFGRNDGADVRGIAIEPVEAGSRIVAATPAGELRYVLGAPGAHLALNSLAVVAAVGLAIGSDASAALAPLAMIAAPVGRGRRTQLVTTDGAILLIDESYNANPASVAAALAAMATVPRAGFRRRIAVLGQMLELGEHSRKLHLGLQGAIDAAGVDLVLACGPDMAALYETLGASKQGACALTSAELVEPLLALVRAGDVVMIKGSLGTRMAPLVEALQARYGTMAQL